MWKLQFILTLLPFYHIYSWKAYEGEIEERRNRNSKPFGNSKLFYHVYSLKIITCCVIVLVPWKFFIIVGTLVPHSCFMAGWFRN
uniref:Uncharacterized protein n=1 Tax=Rhizophora mucronata TaxID=61149 RepID=A0A2P2PZ13_RHIMU